MNVTSPHLTLEELAAHGSNGLSAAAGRHLAECAACRARSRAVAADGVRFLVTRCQPPPSLIDHVLADIDARAPAGMTRRIARRRRRRLAPRPLAGVAAVLAAGAVALAVIGMPGAGHHGTERSAVDTAYVVKRVNDALSMAGPGEIAQMTVAARSIVLPGGVTLTGATKEWSYGGRWRLVTYSSAGRLVYDAGSSAPGDRTLVSYLTRTWARPRGEGFRVAPTLACERAAAALPAMFVPWLPGTGGPVLSAAANVGTALRTAVSCETLTVTGQQRVDGIEAIELTSRPDSPVSETIWISPDTYLPVRVVVRPAGLAPLTADITWLRATPQNLDKLTVPVPAGFRRVPTAPRLRRRDGSRSRACASMPGRRDMARTYRRPGLVVLVAAAAIGLAACSGGSSTPQVASLGKNSSSTNSSGSNTTSPSGTPAQLLAEWTSCMRSHGDPNQANPTIDTNRNIHIVNSLDIKGGLQHTSEAQACNSYLTAASTALGGNQPPGPPNPKLVAYAKCMRANGVPNFPDPTGNGIVIKGNGIDASSPVFQNANKLCTQQTGGGAGSGGGAPPPAGLIFWGRAAQGGGTGTANG